METAVEGDPPGHAPRKRVATMRIYRRLKAMLQRRRLVQDLQDELNSHVVLDTQERVANSDSPETAYYGAKADFGSIPRATEHVREDWRIGVLDRVFQVARYAVR